MGLETEMATYRTHLLELLQHEGKFVVIKGDEILGSSYDTLDDALGAGYDRYGAVPFLVKKIARFEEVHHFSRDLR